MGRGPGANRVRRGSRAVSAPLPERACAASAAFRAEMPRPFGRRRRSSGRLSSPRYGRPHAFAAANRRLFPNTPRRARERGITGTVGPLGPCEAGAFTLQPGFTRAGSAAFPWRNRISASPPRCVLPRVGFHLSLANRSASRPRRVACTGQFVIGPCGPTDKPPRAPRRPKPPWGGNRASPQALSGHGGAGDSPRFSSRIASPEGLAARLSQIHGAGCPGSPTSRSESHPVKADRG